jgi:hypothetical protein
MVITPTISADRSASAIEQYLQKFALSAPPVAQPRFLAQCN